MIETFNTGETAQELKEKYNPDGSILRKCQLRMLDMLIYLTGVCGRLQIDYCLESGNILGALRHGGFIPWDDDVDINVSRNDYEKLCRYLKENPHPQFVLQDEYTDLGFMQSSWAVLRDLKSEYFQNSVSHNIRKYRGMQIDIFVVDNCIIPSLYKFMQRVAGYRSGMLNNNYVGVARVIQNVNKNILLPFCRFLGKYFGDKSIYMYEYGYPFNYSPMRKNIMYPHKPIEFEGHLFNGPANPVSYCRNLYNNYIELPPVDKRNHHQASYKIWD